MTFDPSKPVIRRECRDNLVRAYPNGAFSLGPPSSGDLINEPEKVERWVVWWKDGEFSLWTGDPRENGWDRDAFTAEFTAVKRIEIEAGEGMEEKP